MKNMCEMIANMGLCKNKSFIATTSLHLYRLHLLSYFTSDSLLIKYYRVIVHTLQSEKMRAEERLPLPADPVKTISSFYEH